MVPFVLYPTIGNISSVSVKLFQLSTFFLDINSARTASFVFKVYWVRENQPSQYQTNEVLRKARRSFFLSINRFERKKRLHSTIIAFGVLRNRLAVQPGHMPYLILAGGYDKSVQENVEHFHELKRYEPVSHCSLCVHYTCRLAISLNVDRETLFLPSVSDATKHALLQEAIALLYTPVNEHFGITPLESMVAGRPVIACDSGGPCETIVHGVTGLLVSGSPEVSQEIGGAFEFSPLDRNSQKACTYSTQIQEKRIEWARTVKVE